MRRILLSLTAAAVLILPTAAAARLRALQPAGFLVVRNATTDHGVTDSPVVTVVVRGFVIGRVEQEGVVQLYHLPSGAGSSAAQASGAVVSRRSVVWRGVPGTEFDGSGFRFRAVGGVWRVVIYGAGVSVYAGGHGKVTLHGSVAYPAADGEYALNGRHFTSLPTGELTQRIKAP